MNNIYCEGVDESLRENIDFARSGLELGEYVYAAEICKNILKREAGCVEVWRILQIASKEIYDRRSSSSRVGVRVASFIDLFSAYAFGRGSRVRVICRGLSRWPRNKIGLVLLGQCALENGYLDMVLVVYEELHLLFPKDERIALVLGNMYFNVGDYESGLKFGEQLLESDPSNTEAMNLVEQASLAGVKKRASFGF